MYACISIAFRDRSRMPYMTSITLPSVGLAAF
jgi:hypothetical protein